MTGDAVAAPVLSPHDDLLGVIRTASADKATTFDAKARMLVDWVSGQENERLEALLGAGGFMPEAYDHDSSEEKIYAKAMDVLVATMLRRIGYDAITNGASPQPDEAWLGGCGGWGEVAVGAPVGGI